MEISNFILDMLNHTQQALSGAVDGLTHEELKWQPNPEANSIGFTLWHQIRCEDAFFIGIAQQKPQVWISEKWYEKMNLSDDPDDSGWGYTAEQVAAFPVPELKDLLGYAKAVRSQTIEYLKSITPDRFDEVIKAPFGELTIGQVFSLLLCEITLHTGQIAYLRGLQRGLDK